MAKKNDLVNVQQSQHDRRAELAKWRAGRTHEMELPSGLKVMVADVTITDLMLSGNLPPALLAMAEKAEKSGQQEIDLGMISKNAPEFAALLDALTLLAVKDPPIAKQADEDHLGLDELPGDDKFAIFQFINRETAAVQPFRDEGQPAEVGRAGAQVLDETQPDPAVAERLDRVAGG